MIVVFGSLNIDLVMHVDYLPFAGETLLSHSYNVLAGGKGANQAAAAALFGSETHMFGSVGADEFGQKALSFLKKISVDTTGIKIRKQPTGSAAICVDKKGENFIVVSAGANQYTSAVQVPDKMLTEKTTILFQMEVPWPQNRELIQKAYTKGARIVLNLAPFAFVPIDVLRQVSVLVLNKGEAVALSKKLELSCQDERTVCQEIAKKLNNICVITLGAQGAFASGKNKIWHVDSLEIPSQVDTTGAGDAFVGVLSAALDKDLELQEALRNASIAGGLNCLSVGAQSGLPHQEKIKKYLKKITVQPA